MTVLKIFKEQSRVLKFSPKPKSDENIGLNEALNFFKAGVYLRKWLFWKNLRNKIQDCIFGGFFTSGS